MESKIDIVMPVRDGEETIAEALESVAVQSFSRWRCVVVDDGSLDDTGEIVQAFAARDDRFLLLRQPARGLVAALQDGLRQAGAPFVARLDADDRMAEGRLARQLEVLEEGRTTVVGSLVRFFGRTPSPELAGYEAWLNRSVAPDEIARALWVEAALAHPSVTFRRQAVLDVGGYREGDFPEDYDLWLRGLGAGWSFAKVPEVLTFLRDHDRRLTRTDAKYRRRAFLECKVTHLVEQWDLDGSPVVVWGAGRYGRRVAKALRRRGVRVEAFVDVAPTKIGRSVMTRRVHSPEWLVADDRDWPVLACVGLDEARDEIRSFLAAQGRREGRDFVCLA